MITQMQISNLRTDKICDCDIAVVDKLQYTAYPHQNMGFSSAISECADINGELMYKLDNPSISGEVISTTTDFYKYS